MATRDEGGTSLRILCLGDSLTYGYDVPRGDGWVERLQKSYPQLTFVNEGVNGDTLQGMTYRWERLAKSAPWQGVILMGGTNDILMGRTALACVEKLKALGEQIHHTGSSLIVGVPMEMDFDYNGLNEVIEAYRRHILVWAQEAALPVIDFYEALHKPQERGEIVFDGDVHPNVLGYAYMAQAAYEVVSTFWGRGIRYEGTK